MDWSSDAPTFIGAPSPAATPLTHPGLLDLPSELRLCIYDHLFTSKPIIEPHKRNNENDYRLTPQPILHSCSLVH